MKSKKLVPRSYAGEKLLEWADGRVTSMGRVHTLGALALSVGVSGRSLRLWITGRSEPSVSQALLIKQITGVKCEWWALLERRDTDGKSLTTTRQRSQK